MAGDNLFLDDVVTLLYVRDVEASVRFYRDVLGFEFLPTQMVTPSHFTPADAASGLA